MTTSAPRRVSKAASIAPGGSLIGLVRSCAWENRLPSVGVLLRDAVDAPHAWSNLATRGDLDAGRLAATMRIDEPEVLSRMHPARRLAANLSVRSFFGVDVRGHDLHLAERSFSPAALEESGHHRALWQHGLLPFCIETGELLVDRCGRCERRLEWSAAKPLTRCSHCARPAATGNVPRVDATTLEAGRLLFGIIDPDGDSRRSLSGAPQRELAVLSPGAVFDLCWSLGRLTCGRPARRRAFDRLLDVETKSAVIRAGAEVLATWPEGIASNLRDMARRNPAELKRVQRGIRALGDTRCRWPEQHDLLAARLPQLLSRTRQALLNVHGAALNGQSSLSVLKISARMMPRLVQAGAIDTVEARPGDRLHAIMDAGSIERLAALRNDCMPIGAAAERLGISHEGIAQLLDAALLHEHAEPAVAVMYKDRQISRRSFALLFESIERGASGRLDQRTVTLPRALCQIGGTHKPWGRLLKGMVTGRLSYAVAARGRSPLMASVILAPRDVLAALVGDEDPAGERPDRSSQSLTRRDAAELLNLTPRQMLDAAADELANAVLPGGRLDAQEVLRFARERISPAEISMRFAGGTRRMPSWLREGSLVRLGASGWSRREVEAASTT